VIHEDDSVEPHDLRPPDQRETYTLRDLLQKNFVGTCSVVFRRGLVQELPAWYYDLAMGDWPLHILNAQYGDIGYIDRVMAVRRVHRAGMSQSFTRVQRVKYELEICQHLRSYLGVQYQKSISSATARRYLELAAAQAAHGDIREALSSLQTSITECPVGALKQLVDLAARVARRYERRTRQLLKSVAKPSTGLL
jgi:hypothetical protein